MKKTISIHLEEEEKIAAAMGMTFETSPMTDDVPLIIGK